MSLHSFNHALLVFLLVRKGVAQNESFEVEGRVGFHLKLKQDEFCQLRNLVASIGLRRNIEIIVFLLRVLAEESKEETEIVIGC